MTRRRARSFCRLIRGHDRNHDGRVADRILRAVAGRNPGSGYARCHGIGHRAVLIAQLDVEGAQGQGAGGPCARLSAMASPASPNPMKAMIIRPLHVKVIANRHRWRHATRIEYRHGIFQAFMVFSHLLALFLGRV